MSASGGLRILYIAYPLIPVSRESCGGSEQMLGRIEAEMARRGHHTTVAACDGSRISGRLFPTGPAPRRLDSFEERNAEHTQRILGMLEGVQRSAQPFDVIHDNSGVFWSHAAAVDAPVLATLHLPRDFYSADAFRALPSNIFFNCVSQAQRRSFPDSPAVFSVVPNGIPMEDFPAPSAPREGYLLWVGRICEEKGTHVAIEIARRAGRRLVIAGGVYPFSYHQAYFEREVRPHLDGLQVRHAGVPTFAGKVDLLRRARALLLPSLVDETSSLVAMEAMACGTPVVAFRRGAIPEIVRHGLTGFVVDSEEGMVDALPRLGEIDPLACRAHVETHYSAARMADDYERLYQTANCRPLPANC